MMNAVGLLAVFKATSLKIYQNLHFIAISCYKLVYMLLPCSYAFVSSLHPRG